MLSFLDAICAPAGYTECIEFGRRGRKLRKRLTIS